MLSEVICRENHEVISCLMEGSGRTLELHRDDEDGRKGPVKGEIRIGRVRDVAWNIQAAFVDIGEDRNCYLPLAELRFPLYTQKGSSPRLQQGDELLVQVIRESIQTKAAALSAAITLKGRYLLVTTGNREAGVSRKIDAGRRAELKWLAQHLAGEQCGVLIRTNAAGASEEEIRREYELLTENLLRIRENALHRPAGSVLWRTPAPWLSRLLDLPEKDTQAILLEDEELYRQAEEFLALNHPELKQALILYRDPLLPLAKKYALAERLSRALQEKVWLRSGAYLVIQATEALTAIDVNSGRIGPGKRGSDQEKTFLQVNLEAAGEIAAQLRLRGISGTIIVDFIRMRQESSKRRLMEEFARALAADPVPACLVDMTRLGLVEVTRKKGERPLAPS